MVDVVQVGNGFGPKTPSTFYKFPGSALHLAVGGNPNDLGGGVQASDIKGAFVSHDEAMAYGFAVVGYLDKNTQPMRIWNTLVYRDWEGLTNDLEGLFEDSGTPDGRPRTVAENMVDNFLKRVAPPPQLLEVGGTNATIAWYRQNTTTATKRTKARYEHIWLAFCGFDAWKYIREKAGRSDYDTFFA